MAIEFYTQKNPMFSTKRFESFRYVLIFNVFERTQFQKISKYPFPPFLLPTLPLPLHSKTVRGELAQLVRASA